MAAVPPLLFMWSCKFGGVVGLQHRFAPPLISVCGAVVLMLLNFALAELVGAKTTHPLHSQMLNEIAYIECRSAASFDVVRSYYGDALEGVNELNKRDRVCGETTTLALTDDTNYIFEKRLLKEPNNDDSTVYPSWLKTVGSNPLAYLRYRIIVYRTSLRTFGYLDPYNSFYDGRDPDPYPDKVSSEPANPLGLTDLLSHYMDFASEKLDPFFVRYFGSALFSSLPALRSGEGTWLRPWCVSQASLTLRPISLPCPLLTSGTPTGPYSRKYSPPFCYCPTPLL